MPKPTGAVKAEGHHYRLQIIFPHSDSMDDLKRSLFMLGYIQESGLNGSYEKTSILEDE